MGEAVFLSVLYLEAGVLTLHLQTKRLWRHKLLPKKIKQEKDYSPFKFLWAGMIPVIKCTISINMLTLHTFYLDLWLVTVCYCHWHNLLGYIQESCIHGTWVLKFVNFKFLCICTILADNVMATSKIMVLLKHKVLRNY